MRDGRVRNGWARGARMAALCAAVAAGPAHAAGVGVACDAVSAGARLGEAQLCASSVLAPQGRNRYEPRLAADDDPATAWVEAAPGAGAGEWIEYRFAGPRTFRTILLVPGYGKSARAFRDNARPRVVEIAVDGRAVLRASLRDDLDYQEVTLAAPTTGRRVRVTVLDVYPGARWPDMAISEFRIDPEDQD